MFGFGKKKPLTSDDFATAATDVERRISEGDYDGAAQAATALRIATEANNGPNTALWAEAHVLEARTALALGEPHDALDHLRLATQVEGDDDETVRMRLQNEMSLGDMLSELGELDEAEAVHRRSLEERRSFFGEHDPGFGYGAESLGTVLLRKGEFEQAAALAAAAADSFRDSDEPHKLSATLILRMLAEKSRDPEAAVLETLTEDDRARVVEAIARTPAYLFIGATIDLRWEVVDHLVDDAQKLACLATIATHSEALGRTDDQSRALEAHAALSAER